MRTQTTNYSLKDSNFMKQVRPLWYFCLAVVFLVSFREFIIQRNGDIVEWFQRLYKSSEEAGPIFNELEFNPEDANPFHVVRMIVFLISSIVVGFVLLH